MYGHLKAIEKGSALAVMQKWFTSHFVDPKIADTRASQKLESASQHRHPQWLAAPCAGICKNKVSGNLGVWAQVTTSMTFLVLLNVK